MIVKEMWGGGGASRACTGEPFVRMLVACSLPENALWYVERWVGKNGISLLIGS